MQSVAVLMPGMGVREEVEWFSASNMPLKRVTSAATNSTQKELEDYSLIPSLRELVERTGLVNADPTEFSNSLGQPFPMQDVLKTVQRKRWQQAEAYQPMPRLLTRPQQLSTREEVHTIFVNYGLLVLLSVIGIYLLHAYIGLEHNSKPHPNFSERYVAPIYFSVGLLTVLAAGRYLLAFFYDFTPYGLDMKNLLAIRAIHAESNI